jgi:FMN reductase
MEVCSMRIVSISSSPSPVSRTGKLCARINATLRDAGYDVTPLSLASLPPEALLRADSGHPALASAIDLVMNAQGVIFATPIFKASFSGLLKTFIDVLPQFALAGKVALPIATGGSLAHVLALDYGLRPVLQSMGCTHVSQGFFVWQDWMDSEAVLTDARARENLDICVGAFRDGLDAFAQIKRGHQV